VCEYYVSRSRLHRRSAGVLDHLCCNILLGIDFQAQHSSVVFKFGGNKTTLTVCGFRTLRTKSPTPFKNLTADCHPVAVRSRKYSQEDHAFINEEVRRLLKEGIIEPSQSPLRAQVVAMKGENHKRRMAIDYSQTIKRFTLLDAFPLPNINELVNQIAQFRVFSTVDLKSAYHQIPLREADKPHTAFEASAGLYQFTRLPFGVTNAVACFQRIMTQFVQEEKVHAVFPYLDNITICGQKEYLLVEGVSTSHQKEYLLVARLRTILLVTDRLKGTTALFGKASPCP